MATKRFYVLILLLLATPVIASDIKTAPPQVTQTTAGTVKSAGQLLGTNTNDDANAGNSGQYLENNRSSNTPNATTAQIWSIDSGNSTYNDGNETGITLTAGDWDITGTASISSSGITTDLGIFIGTAKGNANTGLDATRNQSGGACSAGSLPGGGSFPCWAGVVGPYRVKVANGATATYYLKGFATFSSGSVNAVGNLRARRVR